MIFYRYVFQVNENTGTAFNVITGISVTDGDGPQDIAANRVPESQFECSMISKYKSHQSTFNIVIY